MNVLGVSGPQERLSVILPMWNEEDGFEPNLRAVIEACDDLERNGRITGFEVLLVDDGSSDSTPDLVDAAAGVDRRVRALHHPTNRGLGAAIRSGLVAATGGLILYTDADLPVDLSEIDRAMRLMEDEGADLVTAYRLDRRPDGWRRFVYSLVWNALVRVSLRISVRDVNFACKLLRAGCLDAGSLRSEGSFIDAEIVARVERSGARVVQFGTPYRPRQSGRSTLSSLSVIRVMLRDLRRLRPELCRIRPRDVRAISQ